MVGGRSASSIASLGENWSEGCGIARPKWDFVVGLGVVSRDGRVSGVVLVGAVMLILCGDAGYSVWGIVLGGAM